MADLKDYKCPNCNGGLKFSSENQNMHCEFCGSDFDMEVMKALDLDMEAEKPDDFNWNRTETKTFSKEDSAHIANYICNSCGGEVICDTETTAMFCPYCGNPIVMKSNCDGEEMPDLIIPFKLDKKTAKDTFYRHLSGKKLLPKVFRTEAHIDEIKGIYIPFWLFGSEATGNVSYRGTKVRSWSSGSYYYTETSYYSIFRRGGLEFENIPADASQKFADDLMDSLEPYRLAEKKEFQTAYLAGYYADKYDVSMEDCVERANLRAKKSVEDSLRSSVNGYSTVTVQNSQITLHNGSCKYAMLPVWILDTTWNGKKFRFAMNGQTGKFVGNLPCDRGLYWKYFGIWLASLTAVATVVLSFIL